MSPIGDDEGGTNVDVTRRRLHKVSDMIQVHEGRLGEHGVLISVLSSQVEALRQTTASREQLDHAVASVKGQLVAFHGENTLKLENFDTKLSQVRDDLTPIKNGIYWAVGLILTTVILALLALVLKR